MGTKDLNNNVKRTHYCGEVRLEDIGEEAVVIGWVNRVRDMGNLVFADIRDREGIIQVVFPEKGDLLDEAKKLKMEFVVKIQGTVRAREEKLRNPHMLTGDVEIEAGALKVLNRSAVTPFVIADPPQATEELRFKYRYLDLRRPAMQRNFKLRHKAVLAVRNFMDKEGFYEIETPFLTKSTPEGARDYLVPSRIYKGKFFALPQSPQMFKQLLMISGFDKYFQVVRCFRDEDLRADRQPEFTQVDVEMSFVEKEDVIDLTERLMQAVFSIIGVDAKLPFPRFSYAESMEKYGTDKPDLRFGMEIQDLTELGASIESPVIRKAIQENGVLKGLLIEKGGEFSRSRLDKLNQRAQDLGGKGIIWIKKQEDYRSSLKLSQEDYLLLWEKIKAESEDLVLLAAGRSETVLKVLGEMRLDLRPPSSQEPGKFCFVWVTDFPLFEWSDEEKRFVSMHHPFTSYYPEDEKFMDNEPGKVRARAYDLVLNGSEIGGGSIRIHDLEQQRRVFAALGLKKEETEDKFGFFLEALKYGAPPHGGIALGLDRIVMLMAGEDSIRDMIAFPKTTSSLCLLTGSPSSVDDKQLSELGLKKNK
ncbi:MAG: aspartate--tRNA ligase [Candidatus Aminicenantes bacterium]|nr:aspartate--tRNA ligase [Candidatus Aminicenantes bacterium]